MLGKAINTRIHMEYEEQHVNNWLIDNPHLEIVSITMAIKPADQWHQCGEAYMIVYREV